MPIFIEGQIIKSIIIHYSKKFPLHRLGCPVCIDIYPVRMIWTYMSGTHFTSTGDSTRERDHILHTTTQTIPQKVLILFYLPRQVRITLIH